MVLRNNTGTDLDFTDLFNKFVDFSDQENVDFSAEYKLKIFALWYQSGKIGSYKLHQIIPVDPQKGKKVGSRQLENWIKNDFVEKALRVDQAVEEWQTRQIIDNEIEMLERQADLGRLLQSCARDYLLENGIKSERSAISALIQGAKLERDTVIPGEKRKMASLSSEELVKFLLDKTPEIIENEEFVKLSEQIESDKE